ncbi:glutamate/gamma-aminobutyrate family transporter YjeM [Clostridium sp. CF011]|uniref:glutamate/gamma-aminobutyrate family transporter YjeM n=1 Tax=Clostridium sp. CF011 TaxID=2843318 RepID=UPI001C0E35B0|nr:glutamate/gamma-aminobutyrate family transporter YjeM [Clostridium sp. CF011]MBU3092359.1 glutamate/gamma-aminobutyrate family transporter YjeM [Clostridium sp. CF011]WAG68371.1 glutamate/gamma-aminobutyrate family transporter YjeM [Clostridium sp. CF011]
MSEKVKSTKHLTLVSLVLMIFTSVYGFNNIPRSFYKMGYAAIPWYILSGITFFIPFAFMLSEFGAAFKDEKGGIYSWMEKSVGAKFAFMATFMWYASYVIWMVNVASGVWVPISNAIFGKDTTQTWALFGLTGPKTLGILGMLWIIFVTFISTKGLDKIKKVTSLGGTAVALLNVVLLVGSLLVLIGNHGQLAQPITGLSSFISSPDPAYSGNMISSFAFVVFAIFAYGGIEVVGGLVDETENAEKNFPKGVVISAIIISVGYALGLFLVGIFTNWSTVMTGNGVHLGNVGYVVMSNLGYSLGSAFGASEATCLALAHGVARFVGLSMFLALAGAFFTLMFSPLKQLIEGTPAKLWPGKMAEMKNGMPQRAMWIQATIVCVIIALVSFGGENMSGFFVVLVAMTNVAMTLPYMFIAFAFTPFKKNKDIIKPFEIFKTERSALIWTIVVMFTVGFANFFSIIQPALEGKLIITLQSIGGPVFFGAVAWFMYSHYEKKYLNKNIPFVNKNFK